MAVTADEVLRDLKGAWTLASLEVDGQQIPASAFGGASVDVTGNRFISRGMGAVYEGTLRLDPATTPAQFDMKFTKGPEKGNTAYGIYSLDGVTWRICLTTHGS